VRLGLSRKDRWRWSCQRLSPARGGYILPFQGQCNLIKLLTNPKQDSLVQAYLKCLLADVLLNDQNDFAGRLEGSKSLITSENLHINLRRGVSGRRFLATGEGLIGIGPGEMIEGDKIAIFSGSEVPFVLRERPDGNFTFVGECYVHGRWMSPGMIKNSCCLFLLSDM
jgi:hypothetical protein